MTFGPIGATWNWDRLHIAGARLESCGRGLPAPLLGAVAHFDPRPPV